ncbi:MAG: hypothetical protein HY774_19325 [Acidobacteria bacterium]|nr:hypothetical protein [Acidobacteriota bacterium]
MRFQNRLRVAASVAVLALFLTFSTNLVRSIQASTSEPDIQKPAPRSTAPPAVTTKVTTKYAPSGGPATLTYSELIKLSEVNKRLSPGLQAKMDRLLKTPFIWNGATPQPRFPTDPKVGKVLRVAEWNIERGLNFDLVVAALSGPESFAKWIDLEKYPVGGKEYQAAIDQARLLQDADVLVLNELDWGVKRTDYRNVAKELATALNMNYAYGIEFLEIDPVQVGTEEFEGLPDADRAQLKKEIAVDKKRFLGMHGTAVLARFPILNASILRLPVAYDWFKEEQKTVSLPEKAKRQALDKIFLEKVLREIRRGGRNLLRVDLEVPELAEKTLTVLALHTENKCKPDGRQKQLQAVLETVKSISNPVVLAGDMNTTLSDGTPTSIKREITKRLGSKQFWTVQGIKYATGVGLVWDVVTGGINFLKNQHDPTARHIPVVAPNPEVKFFEMLEGFRFDDGYAFDFRGNSDRTVDGRKGTLANSNQRGGKGFTTTFAVERTIGPAGRYKLDWVFVKAYSKSPRDGAQPYKFAPHFPRTMAEINDVTRERISDHCPMTVELPLTEPNIATGEPTEDEAAE